MTNERLPFLRGIVCGVEPFQKPGRGGSEPRSLPPRNPSKEIGPMRRERGTVESDRWRGKASLLAGSKLMAVMPVLGWWQERREFRERVQRFSLIVSFVAAGLDVYTPIRVALEAAEVTIDAS